MNFPEPRFPLWVLSHLCYFLCHLLGYLWLIFFFSLFLNKNWFLLRKLGKTYVTNMLPSLTWGKSTPSKDCHRAAPYQAQHQMLQAASYVRWVHWTRNKTDPNQGLPVLKLKCNSSKNLTIPERWNSLTKSSSNLRFFFLKSTNILS